MQVKLDDEACLVAAKVYIAGRQACLPTKGREDMAKKMAGIKNL